MKDRIHKGLVHELETLRSIDSKTKNVKGTNNHCLTLYNCDLRFRGIL